MKPTTLITILAPLVNGIQVNYYWDGGCGDFALDIPNVPSGSCYNYAWSNTNSALVASCEGYRTCSCTFYTQDNCGGPAQSRSIGGGCASNWGWGFRSFRCVGSVGWPGLRSASGSEVEGAVNSTEADAPAVEAPVNGTETESF
ncbi:hypothetical protein QBC44DRAFT_307542 [Cladorrhinum sp. PSN332]|nr:hypothetical protein QBC44DRAFT_307542 [Cladorrhinum sp. PSN332]